MKKILILALMVLTMAAAVPFDSHAASSMAPSISEATGGVDNPEWPSRIVVAVALTSETDGTFTSYQITNADIPARRLGIRQAVEYWDAGYYLLDAWITNGASSYPDTAGAITVTIESGKQLVGTSSGDTLSASTSASGVGQLSAARSAGQRGVTGRLTVASGDTQSGTATTVNTLYLELGR